MTFRYYTYLLGRKDLFDLINVSSMIVKDHFHMANL